VNFYGVDADSRCDYRSIVDFVRFVWEHFERYPIRKLATTFLPLDNAPTLLRLEDTRLLHLKHYRAISDGWWKDRDNCAECLQVSSILASLALVANLKMTALVLFADGRLPPCATYALMHISVIYNILN